MSADGDVALAGLGHEVLAAGSLWWSPTISHYDPRRPGPAEAFAIDAR
ncbi:hypothetical protein [Gordonia lacunae]|nr:hypothetical protein [Gordonia lacunae]